MPVISHLGVTRTDVIGTHEAVRQVQLSSFHRAENLGHCRPSSVGLWPFLFSGNLPTSTSPSHAPSRVPLGRHPTGCSFSTIRCVGRAPGTRGRLVWRHRAIRGISCCVLFRASILICDQSQTLSGPSISPISTTTTIPRAEGRCDHGAIRTDSTTRDFFRSQIRPRHHGSSQISSSNAKVKPVGQLYNTHSYVMSE